MSEPQSGAPYREPPPKQARWICTVCYRTATTDEAGECDCSGTRVARLPLDNQEVVEMVRTFAAARSSRRQGRLMTLAVVGAIVVAVAICLGFGIPIELPGLRRGDTSFSWILFACTAVGFAAVTFTQRKPPTETHALLTWLHVKVTPQ